MRAFGGGTGGWWSVQAMGRAGAGCMRLRRVSRKRRDRSCAPDGDGAESLTDKGGAGAAKGSQSVSKRGLSFLVAYSGKGRVAWDAACRLRCRLYFCCVLNGKITCLLCEEAETSVSVGWPKWRFSCWGAFFSFFF